MGGSAHPDFASLRGLVAGQPVRARSSSYNKLWAWLYFALCCRKLNRGQPDSILKTLESNHRHSVLSPTTASRVTFYRNTTTLVRVILVYNDFHNFFHLENCFYLCVYVCVGICTDVCSKKPEEGAGCPGAGVTVVVSCHVSARKRTWGLWESTGDLNCWATLLIS